ncbi:MAG: hypothetical protein ACK5LT_12680 [Lachnospirales bacterium]
MCNFNLINGEIKNEMIIAKGETNIRFNNYKVICTHTENDKYIIPLTKKTTKIKCNGDIWLLPLVKGENSFFLSGNCEKEVNFINNNVEILVNTNLSFQRYGERPNVDIARNEIVLDFVSGEILSKAWSYFYWDTMLPSIIEKSDATTYPLTLGYVVSTLQEGEYAGTYPDVDHEFQTKGRLAIKSDYDLAIVKRMMDLQFKLMEEDPTGLYRNPCAVQPNGDREYHVRRNSFDNSENAEMFLITGNVEILETAWLYFSLTKDREWISKNIVHLENSANLLIHLTDNKGKLWSDVYYEDQVIKDGRECMSAAMATNALKLLSELENLLGRSAEEEKYLKLSKLIGSTMSKDLPDGFWDTENKRYVDWVDRNGVVHDHIHLLANCLPVIFDYASKEQEIAVAEMIEENYAELQRFPTFLSPNIEDYTDSEIGNSPYDLCAAGRYWCWDAAYWSYYNNGKVLKSQLIAVAKQGEIDSFKMGERYDMNHVYYIDDKNWHGAPYYYEYPCVFSWVLIHEYLGISPSIKYDLKIKPQLIDYGRVKLESYEIEYEYNSEYFEIKNLANRDITVELEIGHLYKEKIEEMVINITAKSNIRISRRDYV